VEESKKKYSPGSEEFLGMVKNGHPILPPQLFFDLPPARW